jgi:hypothetical protein
MVFESRDPGLMREIILEIGISGQGKLPEAIGFVRIDQDGVPLSI